MEEAFSRTRLLIGDEALLRLQQARVAVFGIGGVGGYVVEALARCGVGSFDLTDNDIVCPSNLNRQIIATRDTLGQYKVDVMRERILSVNPQAEVCVHRCFYLPEKSEEFDFAGYTYVVDAVDTVTAKIDIILRAREAGVPVISSMGTGNKLDASRLQVGDIYDTTVCPLARVMRRELRKRGVESLKVVYSTEKSCTNVQSDTTNCANTPLSEGTGQSKEKENGFAQMQSNGLITPPDAGVQDAKSGSRRSAPPGSIAFVPSVAGLLLAGEVVRDIIEITNI